MSAARRGSAYAEAEAVAEGREAEPRLWAGVEAPADFAAVRTTSTERPPLPAAYQEAGDTTAARLMIRSGRARVEVDSIEPAADSLQAVAEDLGGHTTGVTIRRGDRQVRAAELELRVPAERFDALIASLEDIGEVEELSVGAQEVTEQFRDLSVRASNLRRLEERLLDLLARRTGDLEDVLAVERELARVRQEVEQVEGRLRYLRDRVALSTLTVRLVEPQPFLEGTPGTRPIAEAFRRAWENFIRAVALIIEAVGALLPLAVVFLIGWGVWRWWRRRRWSRARGIPAED